LPSAAQAEGRPILEVAVEMSGLPREELARLLDPRGSPRPARGKRRMS
jgi:hypothetical protein